MFVLLVPPLNLHSFSALHHAALTGTTELLSLLLEAQATVDIKDINGTRTASAADPQPANTLTTSQLQGGKKQNMKRNSAWRNHTGIRLILKLPHQLRHSVEKKFYFERKFVLFEVLGSCSGSAVHFLQTQQWLEWNSELSEPRADFHFSCKLFRNLLQTLIWTLKFSACFPVMENRQLNSIQFIISGQYSMKTSENNQKPCPKQIQTQI